MWYLLEKFTPKMAIMNRNNICQEDFEERLLETNPLTQIVFPSFKLEIF